jgi:hypothetical protein
MNHPIIFFLIFFIGEIAASLVFLFILNPLMKKDVEVLKTSKWNGIYKGILERFILFLAMINGITMILPLFGALKIGTRLESEKGSKVSNEYFLIGNLLSVLFVIIYYLLYHRWCN